MTTTRAAASRGVTGAAFHLLATVVKTVVVNDRVAFRAADEKLDWVLDVHPARGQRADGAGFELEQPFPTLIAIAIPARYRSDVASNGFDIAQQPHQDIQLVRAQVAKAADAGDLRVSHPPPLRIEPSAQRAVMAI
jgi:hypothetical protein